MPSNQVYPSGSSSSSSDNGSGGAGAVLMLTWICAFLTGYYMGISKCEDEREPCPKPKDNSTLAEGNSTLVDANVFDQNESQQNINYILPAAFILIVVAGVGATYMQKQVSRIFTPKFSAHSSESERLDSKSADTPVCKLTA